MQEEQLEEYLQNEKVSSDADYDELAPKIADHLQREAKALSNTMFSLDLLAEYMSDDEPTLTITPKKKIGSIVAEAKQTIENDSKTRSKQYCEERTGLLTNEVHHEKYIDAQLSDDCDSSDENNTRFRVNQDSFVLGG